MNNNLYDEMSFNFINYAAACNSDRAIPDAKSGLKPVARRILYGAFDGGRVSSKPHVKCARIVGDVMGNLHPHGDSSIYGALVRLAQNWIMRYPLIDFHGNVGNIGGDGPAAPRYTEARLSKIAEDGLLDGIKKRNVNFIPNYDETSEEPITLPSIFPNLLCNPNTGIGVAMACNWLPHNLREVAKVIHDYTDGEEITYLAPDFPTGGIIINKDEIYNIVQTGRGSIKVRGQYKIEKNHIVFYEIPYNTTIEGIITQIGELCEKEEIKGITNIRDESTLKGLRIVIDFDKKISPQIIVRELFKKTDLQNSISYNQIALVDKTPTELNLKDCIKIYLEHNEECLIKEKTFDKEKAEARKEIVEGLLKALEDIDNIISLIKKSNSSNDAKDKLIDKYSFSEVQAKAIVNMKLGSLAGLERIELENENSELEKTLNEIENILASKDIRIKIILNRLDKIVDKFGDNRRTELMQIAELKGEEKELAEVIPEEVVISLTLGGEIKKIPKKNFRTQRRNGKGIKNGNEAILETISTNTIDTLMLFSSKGKMYRLLTDKVPEGTNTSGGCWIGNLIKMDDDETIIAATSLERQHEDKYVVFFTKNGLIKKTPIEDYMKSKRNCGCQAIKFKDEDSLANVVFTNKEDFMVITKKGYAIKFKTDDVNIQGKVASGVKAINLIDDEVICGMRITENQISIVTENGFGKVIKVSDFSMQGRGGRGVICYKPTKATGNVIGATMIKLDDNILLTGSPNSICIQAKEIPMLSRTSQGNMMIKDSKLTGIIRI